MALYQLEINGAEMYIRNLILSALLLTNCVFAQEAMPEWEKSFLANRWQEIQGLSCGSNNISFKDGQIVTFQFGKTFSEKYKVESFSDKEKLLEISTVKLIKDVPNMRAMFPQWVDKPTSLQLYSFKIISDHKVLLTRKTQMVDLMAMLKDPNYFEYKPEEIQNHILFDCN